MRRIVPILAVVFMTLGVFGNVLADYAEDMAVIVKSADWSKMETVTIVLTEFSYSPSTLILEKNVPYKLEIVNKGKTKHYFTAQDFFKSIAVRKAQSNTDGEIKAAYFTAIEVYPGRSIDLYFVAFKEGVYDLLCTIEGHAKMGMVGKIEVK